MTVGQLAEVIDEKPVAVIKFLMTDLGVMAAMTQSLDPATCVAVVEGFGMYIGGDEDEDDEDDEDDDDYYYDDDDDDDDEYDEYDEAYNDVIPNALLDQIDPDGAIERMPQLLSDPQFYRDVAIVVVLFMVYAFGRLNNPLYDITDVNQIDFSKFY
mmetsp:Transcript_23995/g.35686  ORF Transcript_23995/g.35686 Transcript_23995/m.35686 type:complete len:156 (+) Transcript_23995:642-1109(+)